MNLYKIWSLIKVLFWALILIVDYTMINVFEDPVVAIGLGLVGAFIFSRGVSFFVFFYAMEWFRKIEYTDRNLVDSYKLSFLFWLFSLINVLLLLQGKWGKLLGLFLLGGFILVQYLLFLNPKK